MTTHDSQNDRAQHAQPDDVTPGSGAPEPGTDSPVEDWFGQSAAADAELADKLVDAVGEDEAERQFEAQAQGKATQDARHGDHIDPTQGEHAYQRTSDSTPSGEEAAAGHAAAEPVADAQGADDRPDAAGLLGIYLRDHHAGSVAGVALVRRCHDNNLDSEFESGLRDLVAEIERDAEQLTSAMTTLGVEPSLAKDTAARAGEFVARLKSNGRLVHYSPTSRVLELEGLIAGINAKRRLWHSLRVADQEALDADALTALSDRADRQISVAETLHDRAVTIAFTS